MTSYPMPARAMERGGAADVVYVLCLMQAGFLLLAGLGEMLLMGGNALYLILPLAKMVVLLYLAAKVVTGRRWALISLTVVQALTLLGFGTQLVAGALPWVDFTINLVVLITNLAMPIAMLYLCAVLLPQRRPVPPAVTAMMRPLPVPQDPYAPAPLVTSATVPEVPHVVVPTAVLPRDVSR